MKFGNATAIIRINLHLCQRKEKCKEAVNNRVFLLTICILVPAKNILEHCDGAGGELSPLNSTTPYSRIKLTHLLFQHAKFT